jgi:ABC-type lipoprotein release transport system permease subunit
VLPTLTTAQQRTLTGREFFPSLISGPFHSGLVVVFAFAAILALLAALASMFRGARLAPTSSLSPDSAATTATA